MPQGRGSFRSHEAAIAFLQRVADAALVIAAHDMACRMYGKAWTASYTLSSAVAVIVFLLAADASTLYRPWRGASMKHEIGTVWSTWAVVVPILLFLGF